MPKGMTEGMTDREKTAYYIKKYGKGLSANRKKEKKDTLMMKAKRKAKELIGGKNTYLKKKKFTTTRTEAHESALSKAGVSYEKIKKLRDKQ